MLFYFAESALYRKYVLGCIARHDKTYSTCIGEVKPDYLSNLFFFNPFCQCLFWPPVIKANLIDGNSIVYRNHKVCDGSASLYDGVPSYIVLLKWLHSIISQKESFHMMESHHMMEFHHMMTFHHIMNKRCACCSSGLPASEGPDRRV